MYMCVCVYSMQKACILYYACYAVTCVIDVHVCVILAQRNMTSLIITSKSSGYIHTCSEVDMGGGG